MLDIGAGTGILSLFCKTAGASKVYAVEASPMAIHLKKIVIKNKAEDVIGELYSKLCTRGSLQIRNKPRQVLSAVV